MRFKTIEFPGAGTAILLNPTKSTPITLQTTDGNNVYTIELDIPFDTYDVTELYKLALEAGTKASKPIKELGLYNQIATGNAYPGEIDFTIKDDPTIYIYYSPAVSYPGIKALKIHTDFVVAETFMNPRPH